MHCHCLPVKGFICITAHLQDSPIRQLVSLACMQELGHIGWQQRWFETQNMKLKLENITRQQRTRTLPERQRKNTARVQDNNRGKHRA